MNNFKSYFSLLKVEHDVLVKRARIPFYWPFNLLLLLMNKALRSQRAAGWRKERGWKARGWLSGLGRQGGLRADAGGGLAGRCVWP